MSTLIKGGTIVAADRSYAADVLIEGETIQAIGAGLSGDKVIDAHGCMIMPGGIDPHTHLDMPFMGTNSADNYDSGTRAAISGGTTMVVDFCIPDRGQPLMDAIAAWDKRAELATTDYSYHMCITYWSDKVREDMAKVVDHGVTTFKHFMAYKGSLMVNDEEMFASFERCAELGAMPLVHAENGDLVQALAEATISPRASPAPRATRFRARRKSRARRPTARSCSPTRPACRSISCTPPASRRMRRSGARAQNGMRVYGEPLIQHLVLDESEYYNKDWQHAARRVDVAALPRQEEPGRSLERPARGFAAGGRDRPLRVHDQAEGIRPDGLHQDPERHRRSRRPHAGALDLWRRHGTPDAERVRRRRPRPISRASSTSIRARARSCRAPTPISSSGTRRRRRRSRRRTQVSVIDYNVFEGIKVQGLPRYTLSRGSVVFEDGKVLANNGRGRFVKREPFAADARALAKYKAFTAAQGRGALT